ESDGRPGTPVEVPAHYEKRDLIVAKGTMLVMHGNLIHGSYANRSPDRSRPMLSMSFIPEGEPFVPGATAQRKVIALR
ncbi:MAG: phytanoyl-CoA dioxygenase family protein, partial [Alphaproteobacteria bacterium]|nr:phytanoyl-CoA dioxygenase family protein [Alphaproteobacteria bacterium]